MLEGRIKTGRFSVHDTRATEPMSAAERLQSWMMSVRSGAQEGTSRRGFCAAALVFSGGGEVSDVAP